MDINFESIYLILSGVALATALIFSFFTGKFILERFEPKDSPQWMIYILWFGTGISMGAFFMAICYALGLA